MLTPVETPYKYNLASILKWNGVALPKANSIDGPLLSSSKLLNLKYFKSIFLHDPYAINKSVSIYKLIDDLKLNTSVSNLAKTPS